VTGFAAEEGLACASCPVQKSVRDSVSCLLTPFYLPVRNTALKKACPKKRCLDLEPRNEKIVSLFLTLTRQDAPYMVHDFSKLIYPENKGTPRVLTPPL